MFAGDCWIVAFLGWFCGCGLDECLLLGEFGAGSYFCTYFVAYLSFQLGEVCASFKKKHVVR